MVEISMDTISLFLSTSPFFVCRFLGWQYAVIDRIEFRWLNEAKKWLDQDFIVGTKQEILEAEFSG